MAAAMQDFLLPQEVVHSQRLRQQLSRQEFTVARGALRILLGKLLGCGPLAVTLETGDNGKPWVLGPHFNVAHSHGQVLIAICHATPVGVDLEYQDPAVDTFEIASVHFSAAEVSAIAAANPGPRRTAEFYRCWTQKEALLKAQGAGLTLALDSFSVATCTGAEAPVMVADTPLFVRSLNAVPGYAAALAAGAPALPVVMHDFEAELLSAGLAHKRVREERAA